MSTYTLRYFPIKARAETIRALLSFSGATWKNEHPAWPQEKANQPFGKLPVLIEAAEDGSEFVLTDSLAIEKYIATKYSISVDGDIKQLARQDEIRNQIKDIYELLVQYKFGPESGRPSVFEKYNVLASAFAKAHESLLTANGSNGHYFGNKTTYVDIALYATLSVLRTISAEVMTGADAFFTKENAPEINKVLDTLAAEPAFASYVATWQ
ncbi:hypothetical protein GGI12_004899 [Dipsacomyces acuminosporus]|nr:hypothetical protein GGI12_004899 [Dipsacomyces acuminosporus]